MTPSDKAFTQAEAYTPNRVVAAQAMGLKYPNIGNDALEAFNKTGIYPGALQDVLIVLWLCSLPDDPSSRAESRDLWNPLRALKSPDEALSKAIAWGAEQNITDTRSDAWWTAYNKFIDIMSTINSSRGNPQLPESSSEEEDDDPNE